MKKQEDKLIQISQLWSALYLHIFQWNFTIVNICWKKKNFVFWYSIIKLWPNLVKVLILDKTIFCCNLWRLLCVCRPSQGIMSIIINRHQATIAQLLTKSTPCPYTNDFRWEMIIPPTNVQALSTSPVKKSFEWVDIADMARIPFPGVLIRQCWSFNCMISILWY